MAMGKCIGSLLNQYSIFKLWFKLLLSILNRISWYVQELKVTGMPIHIFEEEAFCGLSKLQSLRMWFCEISEMPPLNPVKRTLSRITLSRNQIRSIPEDYFFGFSKLRYLELSNNLLTSIFQLHPLSATLHDLYLDSNKLQHFPTSVYNAIYTALVTLSLSGNNLTELRKDALNNVQSLNRLDLKANSISRVEDLRSLHRVVSLTVSDSTSWKPFVIQYWLCSNQSYACHDDVIKWRYFPRYWPFMREIHRSPVNSPHKGQWRGALMFSLICDWKKRLSKQSWGWWFETLSRPLWRHCNVTPNIYHLTK